MPYADTDTIPAGTVVQATVAYNYLPTANLTDSEVQYWLGQDVDVLDSVSEVVEGSLTLGTLNVSGTANQDMQAGQLKAELIKTLADVNAQRAVGIHNVVVTTITSNPANAGLLGGINPMSGFSGTLSLVAVAAILVVGLVFFQQIREAI